MLKVSNAKANVDVYVNDIFIDNVTVDLKGNGEKLLSIPSDMFTIGTIYRIEDGQEIQISNPRISVLKVSDGENEISINVYLNWTDNYFLIEPTVNVTANSYTTIIEDDEFLIDPTINVTVEITNS